MSLKFKVTTRLGNTYIVDARDAAHARNLVEKQLKGRYPKHVPRATAERYAERDISGAKVERHSGGISRD